MSCDDREWILARIAATEAAIIATETAISALASGVQSYSLDTGQTRQSVTKANLSELKLSLASLENRRATLRAQLGCGSVNVVPGF